MAANTLFSDVGAKHHSHESHGAHKDAAGFGTATNNNQGAFFGAGLGATNPDTSLNEALANTVVNAAAIGVETNILLFLSIFVIVPLCAFIRPQIYENRLFYRRYFSEEGWTWYVMSPTALDWWSRCVDGLFAYAFASYLFYYREPATDRDARFYVGLLSLMFIIVLLKWFWRDLFWNHYTSRGLSIFAIFLSTLSEAVTLGVIIGFGVINVWGSMVAMIIVFLWYFAVWVVQIYIYRQLAAEPVQPSSPGLTRGQPLNTGNKNKQQLLQRVQK